MKRLAIVVILGIIGGNIYAGSTEYSKQHPIVYTAEAEEPREVLIEVKPTEKTIEEKIRATFPEDADRAVAIAKAESGLRANAYNPERHKTCSGSFGVMQIACVHHVGDPNELKDVDFNLQKAREIYEASLKDNGNGWIPWGAYKNKSYKKYM
jgi:hypothetical protein